MRSGFYITFFIIPKKGSRLCPILDLRVLNQALHKLLFKMLLQEHIFKCICPRDWFAAINMKDAYFHVFILPRHRPFLHFAFDGWANKYKVLLFRLSLLPYVYMKVAETTLIPMREHGIRILNNLNQGLIQKEQTITAAPLKLFQRIL